MLSLSGIMRDGHIAGLQCGDSYDAIVAALGPAPLLGTERAYPFCTYGDLEIYFERQGSALRANFIYLNASGSDIRLEGAVPFSAEGLRWDASPAQLCEWLIERDVPFSYDPLSQEVSGTVDILLSGARPCVCSPGLSEIYVSFARRGRITR